MRMVEDTFDTTINPSKKSYETILALAPSEAPGELGINMRGFSETTNTLIDGRYIGFEI